MPKKHAVNDARVTELITEYVRHPKRHPELRDKILKKILPLVEAAMAKRYVPKAWREDVRQECIVKLLTGIPKFNPKRGNAFGFFWTVISNTITTQCQRMTPRTSSLTSGDSSESDELDAIGADTFRTPENQYILTHVAETLGKAFQQNDLHIPRNKKSQKVMDKIRQSVQSGEFFYDRAAIMKKLRGFGLRNSEVKFYVDYILIRVRAYLLDARRDLSALTDKKVTGSVPPVTSR